MYQVESTPTHTAFTQVMTTTDKIIMSAFGLAFVLICVGTGTWPLRHYGMDNVLASWPLAMGALVALLIGLPFGGFGVVLLLGAARGKIEIRFDWKRGLLTDTRWHFRGGYRTEQWPAASVRHIETEKVGWTDGPDTFRLAIDIGVDARLRTVAVFATPQASETCAAEIRRRLETLSRA